MLLSTFFLAAGFCASVADCGSVPAAGVDVAVLVPDAPLSLAVAGGVVLVLVGGGTASVAGGVDADVLDEVLAGSAGGAELVGGGVDDSGETARMLMFCCVEPALLPASSLASDAEPAPCGDSTSPGGFKSGWPVCAAIATFGLLFITPMAR